MIGALMFAGDTDKPKKAIVALPRKADVVVNGPKQAEPGDLVVLDASESVGIGGLAWAIHPLSAVGKMLSIEDGKKIVFATSKPGSYVFYVAASTPDGKQVKIIPWEVLVGSPVPPPDDPPKPPKPPKPPIPPPDVEPWEAELTKWTYDRVMELSDSDKKNTSKNFADATDAVISMLGAGAIPDRSSSKTLTEQVSAALLANLRGVGFFTKLKWQSLLPALADKFDELDPKTPDGWEKVLGAISRGLRQVQNG